MEKLFKYFLFFALTLCLSACGGDDEPDGPDINNVNSSLDATFAKLNGKYSATWAESLNDVTYDMTFKPYASPRNEDISISDGGNVNFTKRVRIFGRVHFVKTYSFSSGHTSEQTNKEYLYGIESTVGQPYEVVFYPFSSVDDEDFIYGLSSSYHIKSISVNSFELSMGGKDGDYHLFQK